MSLIATLDVVTEPVYDALSQVNDEGEPFLSNAQMVMGDGTVKVQFKNGRAKVPHSIAHHVAKHPHVDVLGYNGAQATQPVPRVASEAAHSASEDVAGLEARIRELEAALALTAAKVPAPPAEAPEPVAEPEPDPEVAARREEALRLAREHLESEGEHVPDPEAVAAAPPAPVVSREGFETETADGQARCQAAKGDGSQCANPAVENGACGLGKHKEQLTA